MSKNIDLPEDSSHMFPAVRGIQAGREYYIVMCPLKMVSHLFLFNEQEIPAKIRVQRVLNKARIPEISSYLVNNKNNYIFSAITASVDGNLKFVPFEENGLKSKLGVLYIEIGSNIIINDGQHRRASIIEALKQKSELGHETISVVFYHDRGLRHSQQMFTDLNKNAVKPSKSLNILFDHRDQFSSSIVDMLDDIPIFAGLTELEKTSISNRAHKVFTLNSIYSATASLLSKTGKKKELSDEDKERAIEFWNEVYKNIPEWISVVEGNITPSELRDKYVNVFGIFLHALGIAGEKLINKKNWKSKLKNLRKINYLKTNKEWEGVCMIGGKLTKQSANLVMTAKFLEKHLK